jgi:AcrR family transcriptional regulator
MAAVRGGGRGRRRDPGLDARILAAVLAEYGRTGWAGFTIDAVARRAGVGKSSVYLRWATREQLLAAALEMQTAPLTTVDTGSFDRDVLALATALMLHFLDPAGWATVRIAVDAVGEAVVGGFHERIRSAHEVAAGRMLGGAIERGELPPGVPLQPIADALYGGVLMHVLAMSPADHERAAAEVADHVAPLVALILAGARSQGEVGSGQGR